jgi:hypothetical protein
MTALRRVGWQYPWWWVAALSGLTWVWLARWPGHDPHAHGTAFSLAAWTAMVFAMMLPLVLDNLHITANRSLWRRRHRAMSGFLCGYAGVWVAAGALVAAAIDAAGALHVHMTSAYAAPVLALAALWQLSAMRRRLLVSCHRTVPLAPRGWRADRDCLRYGWTIGTRCVMTCGLSMLACAMAGHNLAVMAIAAAVAAAERVDGRATRPWTASALASAALALLVLGP